VSSVLAFGCDAALVSVGAWSAASVVPSDGSTDATTLDGSGDASSQVSVDAASADVAIDDDAVRGDANSGIYLEAESGELSGGFTIGDDPLASNGQFILPPVGVASDNQPGLARASYQVDIATAGRYIIWGRIHSPDAVHNHLWFQVDGGTWHLWRIATGEIWYWNRIHDGTNYYMPLVFDLVAGRHQLLFANAVDGLGLDRLYLTAEGDSPPQTETPCAPPNSIPVQGACVPSCGILGGQTCGAGCNGRMLITTHVYDCVVCCF